MTVMCNTDELVAKSTTTQCISCKNIFKLTVSPVRERAILGEGSEADQRPVQFHHFEERHQEDLQQRQDQNFDHKPH